jgi:hypothetical protein
MNTDNYRLNIETNRLHIDNDSLNIDLSVFVEVTLSKWTITALI